MRRNRAKEITTTPNRNSILQPSTPLLLNQNSNSCSNDTICSTLSINNSALNATNSQIAQDELKIRNLLKELQTQVKNCQVERDASEPNIATITKTHEKVKREEKLTPFYRKKLHGLYSANLKLSENEIKCLRKALDSINQVRLTQNEIRLLQQQNTNSSSLLSSPINGINETTMTDSKSTTNKKAVTMRRGVLMSILQQAALTLPLWVGEIGQTAPPLCGSNPPESHYVCKVGDKVAALVKNTNKMQSDNDITMTEEDENEDENWILAEVIAHPSSGKYDVEDVDTEDGHCSYTLSKKCVVPLPLWRANPITDEMCIFKVGSIVLALYPQTTCFYRGLVNEIPSTPQDDYLILFEDNTYPEGYSPPLQVPQLYVVAYNDFKK